jgi:cytoskeletal protein RodZ
MVMKILVLAILILGAGAVFVLVRDARYGGAAPKPPAVIAAVADKIAGANGDGSRSTESTADTKDTTDADGATTPEDGDYTYADYNGDTVPYYKGYYYIDGAWIWPGRGPATVPPPKFRPAVRSRNANPAVNTTAHPKSAAVNSAPATTAAPRSGAGQPTAPAKRDRVRKSQGKKAAAPPAAPRGGGRPSAPRGPRR